MKKLNIMSFIFIISMVVITAFIFFSLGSTTSYTGYFNNESTRDFSGNWRITVNGKAIAPVDIPTTLDLPPNSQIRLEKTIPAFLAEKSVICFRSSQQKVKVFMGDELIYSYGYETAPPFGSSPGSLWNIIRLDASYAGETMAIELSSPSKVFSGCINPITSGTKSALLFQILCSYYVNFVSGITLVLTGFLMLLLVLFARIHLKVPLISQPTLYLSLFSIITGTWVTIESRLLQFLFNDMFIIHFLDFLTLASAPVAIQLYLLHIRGYRGDKILTTLFGLGVFNIWMIIILQYLNIADFIDTMITSHILVAVTIGYVFFNEIRSFVLNKKPQSSKATTLALLALTLGALADLLSFYRQPSYTIGSHVGIGLVAFMVILMLESFEGFFKLKIEADRTQLFKELAYMDSLTQLGNRMAYEEILEEYQKDLNQIQRIAIFIADINGLKNINDTFGHSAGDTAISESGTAIRNIFNEWGKAYRIGGDEFCIICENISNTKCESLCLDLNKEMEKVKVGLSDTRQFTVQLALGYAYYDNTEDRIFSIQELVKRADNAMYAQRLYRRDQTAPKLRRDTIQMKRIDS